MSIHQLEKIVTILVLAIYVGVFKIKPPREVSVEILGGSFVGVIVNSLHYLLLFFLIIRNWKKCIYVSTKNIILLLMIGFTLFSIFWSEAPQATWFTSRWLLMTFLFGAYLSWKHSIKEQMWLLAWVMGIVAVESTILCLFLPVYGIHYGDTWSGQWCGIYEHKNSLGAMMTLSAGIFLNLALDNYKYWWILWPGFILSTILIILAKSTTSLVILVAFISLIFIYKLIKQNKSHVLKVILINITLMLIIGTSIWLLDNAYSLVATQGKDLLTFSGRTPMWSELMTEIADRPFLGYGYSGFWNSAEALNIKAEFKWAGDAHNGFITILLELGIFGTTIFTITLLQFLFRALKRVIVRSRTWVDLWPMQFLVYFIIINLSESALINPNLDFLIYVSILLSMMIESQKIRRNRDFRLALATTSK